MSVYIDVNGKVTPISKIFGNVDGKKVEAQSLWVNRSGVASCVYRKGERPIYVIGMDAGAGNGVFPMVYTYDFNMFKACSITMPTSYSAMKPTAIKSIFYSEELDLFVALGYYLQKNYTSSSPLYWFLMYSQDGKDWNVSMAKSYTYYSTNIILQYEKENHLFLLANKGPNVSSSSAKFYFYYSTDGVTWSEKNTITPTNAENAKVYNAYSIKDVLVPGDGYIYLSGRVEDTFYGGSSYYPFLRTNNGYDYELYGAPMDYSAAKKLFGCHSLLYKDGVYYNLDSAMHEYNPDYTSQYSDYYNVGIKISNDDMQSWDFVPLAGDSIEKDWEGAVDDGFFMIGDKIFVSITRESFESYLYSTTDGENWIEEVVSDRVYGSEHDYLYFPMSDRTSFPVGEKLYRTGQPRLSSTTDGKSYIEDSSIASDILSIFSLSSSETYVMSGKTLF